MSEQTRAAWPAPEPSTVVTESRTSNEWPAPDPKTVATEQNPFGNPIETTDVDGVRLTALRGGSLDIAPQKSLLDEAEGVIGMATIGDPLKGNNVFIYDLSRFQGTAAEDGQVDYKNPATGRTFTLPAGSRYAIATIEDEAPAIGVTHGESAVIGRPDETMDEKDPRHRFAGAFTADVEGSAFSVTVDKESGALIIKDNTKEGTVVVETASKDSEVMPLEDLVKALGSIAAIDAVSKDSISARRVLDRSVPPEADNPVGQALIDSLLAGRLTDFGSKVQGTRDLKRGRSAIIEKQRYAMDEVVARASGAVWNARGKMVRAYLDNNVFKRFMKRREKRAELREMAFSKIDQITDPRAGTIRKRMMRLQARKNAWKIAREGVKNDRSEAIASAKRSVNTAKSERATKKELRNKLKFRPYRRRQTLAGQTAGYRASWEASGTDLRMTPEEKARDRQRRLQARMERQRKIEGSWSKEKRDKLDKALIGNGLPPRLPRPAETDSAARVTLRTSPAGRRKR